MEYLEDTMRVASKNINSECYLFNGESTFKGDTLNLYSPLGCIGKVFLGEEDGYFASFIYPIINVLYPLVF